MVFRAKFVADKPQIAHLTTVVYTKLSPPSVNPPSGHKTEAFAETNLAGTDGTTSPSTPSFQKKNHEGEQKKKKRRELDFANETPGLAWPNLIDTIFVMKSIIYMKTKPSAFPRWWS